MANVNTEGLAMNLCEEAINAYNAIKDKFPNIRDIDNAPERLFNLQGENADILGALFKDSIGQSEYICRNGRAIVQCSKEIARVDSKVGLALLAGGAALCLGGYLLYKFNEKDKEIDALKIRVSRLELHMNK